MSNKTPLTCHLDEENSLLVAEVKGPLSLEDFTTLSQAIDPFYAKHGELSGIIINAKKFPFWKGSESFKAHVAFVKNHHFKTKKVAIAMGGIFAKVLPSVAQIFIHPKVKNFGFNKVESAKRWIWSDDC